MREWSLKSIVLFVALCSLQLMADSGLKNSCSFNDNRTIEKSERLCGIKYIKQHLDIDLSTLSKNAQNEVVSIALEFEQRNKRILTKDNFSYWQDIIKAVDIKSKATGDIRELQDWQEAINHAVASAWIAHSPRGTEGNVYRYFRDKIKFIEKWVNWDLLELVLKWEQEFRTNIKNWKDWFFYTFLNNLTWTNIRVWTTKRLKKYSPNFYAELSSILLKNKSNLAFSKEFYSIIKHEERAKMLKKVADKLRKSL